MDRTNYSDVILAILAVLLTALVIVIGILNSTNQELVKEVRLLNERLEQQNMIVEVEEPIEEEIVVEEEPAVVVNNYVDVRACSTTSTFKSYMDYRAITDRSSRQWQLQQLASTNEDGLRTVNGRYLVAMAGYSVGTEIDISIGDTVLNATIGDVKGSTSCAHKDSSILEFIVDTRVMDRHVKTMGNFDVIYKGPIDNLRVYT